tara:strand:- start:3122 stop:3499 length:378 start_codon:yes stop_codon:yes gene_type:complete
MLKVYRVTGDSMFPTLSHDDIFFAYKKKKVITGDIVVMQIPFFGRIVKRVKSLDNDSYILAGDNPSEQSSCCSSPQSNKYMIGTLLFTLKTGCIIRHKSSWMRKLKQVKRPFQTWRVLRGGNAKP